jgi:hypothetical protein
MVQRPPGRRIMSDRAAGCGIIAPFERMILSPVQPLAASACQGEQSDARFPTLYSLRACGVMAAMMLAAVAALPAALG